jgi:uroporphyrin-III C-methyltransferase
MTTPTLDHALPRTNPVAGIRRPAKTPWCALVGAGPGDPELLTLKALRTLRRATVLLVDDLVSDAVVAMALRGRRQPPRVVHVGKRGGCKSTPQAFIERLMVSEALAGERVVRLKGGDPFVFGRGGEEAETLRAQGITVEIINGITSGLAATTALGVPWTHRDHAHGVMLVTGHAREGAPGPDWCVLGAAAAQGLTLIIYMGMARLTAVQAGLLSALPGHTPAAVVQHAGTPQERACDCTLADLAQAARAHGLGSPAIVIVGQVLQARAVLAATTTMAGAAERRVA